VSLDGGRQRRQSEEGEACKSPHFVVVQCAAHEMQ
jgi:hypothetical protein